MNEYSWDELERQLKEIAETGRKTIPVKSLLEYLANVRSIESEVNDTTRDARRHAWESELAGYVAQNEAALELFRSASAARAAALKVVTIINGGAVVALLAFVGTLSSSSSEVVSVPSAATSLLAFVVGVFLASLATGNRYFSSLAARRRSSRWFWITNGITIGLTALSLAAFISGGLIMFFALLS